MLKCILQKLQKAVNKSLKKVSTARNLEFHVRSSWKAKPACIFFFTLVVEIKNIKLMKLTPAFFMNKTYKLFPKTYR